MVNAIPDDTYSPTIPPRIRDIVYWAGFLIGGTALLVTGLAAIWWPEHADAIQQTALVVGNTAAWVAAGLGVVYRPGAQPYTPQHVAVSTFSVVNDDIEEAIPHAE